MPWRPHVLATLLPLVPKLSLVLLPAVAAGQSREGSPFRGELRADAIFARATMLQGGLGLAIRGGYNVRLHLAGAAGVAVKGDSTKSSARADATLRLLLDPFGETRTGLAIGGGLSLLHDGFEGTRPVGVLVLAFEGPPRSPIVWSVEAALGGGARLGIALRRRAGRYR